MGTGWTHWALFPTACHQIHLPKPGAPDLPSYNDKEIFASLASWSMCLVDGAKWSCPDSRISPLLRKVASLYVIETPPWGGVNREKQNDPIASLSPLATLVNDYSATVEVVNADFP